MASEEQLALDGLALNDSTFGLAALDMTPPRQRQEWIGAADSEWQSLVRVPLHENREITATIQILPQSTTNLAMDKIGQVIDKFRLASRSTDGVDLVWTPADGTRVVTFDCLAGEITGMPINWEDGWLAKAPTITITMRCKPYWYATEVTTSTASSSTPFVTLEVASVPGDIPALGRLIVTDTATQSRRHVEWGIENQYYNASTSLLIDSDDMVVSGFSGTQTNSIGGAYDPNASGNSSVMATVSSSPTAVVGTGNLSHIGTFRVKARVTFTATISWEMRLAWQVADGPWSFNDWVPMAEDALWHEVDLGSIFVSPVLSGTQRWTGRIEARTVSGAGTFAVDYLILVPAQEGYGKARAQSISASGVLVMYDQFTSTTAGGALNASSSDSAHTWATSGDATDFAFSDDTTPGVGLETIERNTTTDTNGRYGILGTATPTDVQVETSFWWNGNPTTTSLANKFGVIARWTDSSNYVRGEFVRESDAFINPIRTLRIVQVVAGTPTTVASVEASGTITSASWYVIEMFVYASGRAIVTVYNAAKSSVLSSVEGQSSALATGGALASGKSGIYDFSNVTGRNTYYDNIAVSTPAAEPIVLYSGRNMQFRHDETIRQDSAGTYTGRPPSYRGSRFLVPVGTSRVMVKARRNDVDAATDANVTDATQIQVAYTPRGLAVPRFG